jgi:dynein heavy chain, axonemal
MLATRLLRHCYVLVHIDSCSCITCTDTSSCCGAVADACLHFVQELVHDVLYADLMKRGVPITQPCDLTALLTTDATVQNWTAKGLPADAHSVQNGILTTRASRFPLCIDPQQQVLLDAYCQ